MKRERTVSECGGERGRMKERRGEEEKKGRREGEQGKKVSALFFRFCIGPFLTE